MCSCCALTRVRLASKRDTSASSASRRSCSAAGQERCKISEVHRSWPRGLLPHITATITTRANWEDALLICVTTSDRADMRHGEGGGGGGRRGAAFTAKNSNAPRHPHTRIKTKCRRAVLEDVVRPWFACGRSDGSGGDGWTTRGAGKHERRLPTASAPDDEAPLVGWWWWWRCCCCCGGMGWSCCC